MADINGSVIAIQGTAVSNENPVDGYVLTYVSSNSRWEPKKPGGSSGGLTCESFTSSTTWTARAGVYNVLIVGFGGGGGGSGGATNSIAGGGGGGAIQQTAYIAVTPETEYTITIGLGGSGGSAGGYPAGIGSDGSPTKISIGATNYFYALGGGGSGVGSNFLTNLAFEFGGLPYASNNGAMSSYTSTPAAGPQWQSSFPGSGGNGGFSSAIAGMPNFIGGYSGGAAGGGSGSGGGGGGAGPNGNGGNGGNGTSSGTGSNGSSASANSGAGGGGGGRGTIAGGSGGNGGSGFLQIIY